MSGRADLGFADPASAQQTARWHLLIRKLFGNIADIAHHIGQNECGMMSIAAEHTHVLRLRDIERRFHRLHVIQSERRDMRHNKLLQSVEAVLDLLEAGVGNGVHAVSSSDGRDAVPSDPADPPHRLSGDAK